MACPNAHRENRGYELGTTANPQIDEGKRLGSVQESAYERTTLGICEWTAPKGSMLHAGEALTAHKAGHWSRPIIACFCQGSTGGLTVGTCSHCAAVQ